MRRHFFPTLLLLFALSDGGLAGQTGAMNGLGAKGILWSVDWSPDGGSFGVGGDWTRLFDGQTMEVRGLRPLEQSGRVSKLRWSPDGKQLAVSGPDEATALYDIVTGGKTKLPTAEGTRGITWNASGQKLATAGSDGALQIWSASGELLNTTKPKKAKSLTGVAWNPQADIVVTVSEMIRLYDGSGTLTHEIAYRPEAKGPVLLLCVEWHPSGKFFVVGDYGNHDTDDQPELQFWSREGRWLKTIVVGGGPIRNVSWSPDGRFLASASDALRIWTEEGALQHVGPSPDFLWGVRWKPDGELVLTSSMEGRVTLWTPAAIPIKRVVEPNTR